MEPLNNHLINGCTLVEVSSKSTVQFRNISVSAEATFYAETSVDLSIIQSVDKYRITLNEKLTYYITVINNGPHNCSNVILTDILPHNATLASVTLSQGIYSHSNGKVICYLNNLNNGATASVIITVTPKSCGVLKNTVTVQCAEHDMNLNNNSHTKVIKVIPLNNF